MIKLCISNIAWEMEDDDTVYSMMNQLGFHCLEIAPTRVFSTPYDQPMASLLSYKKHVESFGLQLVSMQSLIYNRPDVQLFTDDQSREQFKGVLKQAIDFASALNIKNLVFGSPKNRVMHDEEHDYCVAIEFFREIGAYCKEKGVLLAIEANSSMYGTNFLTTTKSAGDFVKEVNSEGISLQIDTGTMLINKEDPTIIQEYMKWVSHVHFSEMNLNVLNKENDLFYHSMFSILKEMNYQHCVSIEMRKTDVETVVETMKFVKKLKGEVCDD